MKTVEPIRDEVLVKEIADWMKTSSADDPELCERNFVLWMMGIYSGLRISDIVKNRISVVKGKKSLTLRENKTGKQTIIEIAPPLRMCLAKYCSSREPEEYLIRSRKGYNKPITRQQAYNILNKMADHFKLDNIGCHTMRKTFGYHFYKKYNEIATLMNIFNHSSQSITLRYIGIDQEEIGMKMKKFRIF